MYCSGKEIRYGVVAEHFQREGAETRQGEGAATCQGEGDVICIGAVIT